MRNWCICIFFFFFSSRRRHTRYWRDWSSDVCSSDLTYWEDIVTRMRHFGIYTTFITNQPDAIGDGIYRQVDNIFLFNFTNDADLEKISKVSLADNDTVRSIVRTLPQRHCLSIGKVVCDLPI